MVVTSSPLVTNGVGNFTVVLVPNAPLAVTVDEESPDVTGETQVPDGAPVEQPATDARSPMVIARATILRTVPLSLWPRVPDNSTRPFPPTSQHQPPLQRAEWSCVNAYYLRIFRRALRVSRARHRHRSTPIWMLDA